MSIPISQFIPPPPPQCINFNYSMAFQRLILLQFIYSFPSDGQLMCVWLIVLFPTLRFYNGRIDIFVHVS